MHVDHRLPQIRGHVVECLVPQDAGVVDEDVDPAEIVDGRFDDGFTTFDSGYGVAVGHGHTSEIGDFFDHLGRRTQVAVSGAIDGATEVIDHDLSAA